MRVIFNHSLLPIHVPPCSDLDGGGYLGGRGCEAGTDGAQPATLSTAVVSFNYRLGAFGYLVHPDFGSNFGLLDQIAALQGVHENLAQFRGATRRRSPFSGSPQGPFGTHACRACPAENGVIPSGHSSKW